MITDPDFGVVRHCQPREQFLFYVNVALRRFHIDLLFLHLDFFFGFGFHFLNQSQQISNQGILERQFQI